MSRSRGKKPTQLEQPRALLDALGRVALKIGSSLDLQEMLDAIVGAVADLVPCSLAEISLWDEERKMLVLRALRCTPERAYPLGQAFPPGHGYTGWLVQNMRPLWIPDVAARQDIKPDILPGELPFQSYIGLPLITGDELIGTLVLVHDEAGAFDRDDLVLLESMAGYAAFAIHKTRLYEQLVHHHQELAVLFTIAEIANRAADLGTMLQQALDRVVEVTKANGGAIRLLDPQNERLVLTTHRGLSEAYVRQAEHIPLSQEIVGWVARQAEPSLSQDMWTDPRVSPRLRELLQEVGHRSLAQVPLSTQDRVVGTLGLVSRTPGFFTTEDLSLLNAIGHQLGVAIENARLRQQALEAERLAAVGRVAGTVAHDLGGPLAGIINSADYLSRPEVPMETRQKLSRGIVAASRRLIRTVRGILDYTRNGRLSLRLAPVVLPIFLHEVVEELTTEFSGRKIEVVIDWGYSGEVRIDSDRMAQVIYNIGANARDAMPGGGRLTITTQKREGWVEIRLVDTGPGVPPELAERIFEPFYSYGKREGAGLGLSIARRIVEEHGGKIWMENQARGGAAFVIKLPLNE